MPELGDGEIPNTTAPREHDRGLNVRGSKNAGKPSPAYHQHTLITTITRESDKLILKKRGVLLTVMVTSCFFSRYLRLFIFSSVGFFRQKFPLIKMCMDWKIIPENANELFFFWLPSFSSQREFHLTPHHKVCSYFYTNSGLSQSDWNTLTPGGFWSNGRRQRAGLPWKIGSLVEVLREGRQTWPDVRHTWRLKHLEAVIDPGGNLQNKSLILSSFEIKRKSLCNCAISTSAYIKSTL